MMNFDNTVIAARIESLPISRAARREALAYVAAGETLAELFLSVAKWFEASHTLKPSYR